MNNEKLIKHNQFKDIIAHVLLRALYINKGFLFLLIIWWVSNQWLPFGEMTFLTRDCFVGDYASSQ